MNPFKVSNLMLLYVSVCADVCCNGMPFLLKRGISMTTLHMLWCFEMILFIATKSYTYNTVINMGIRFFNYCSYFILSSLFRIFFTIEDWFRNVYIFGSCFERNKMITKQGGILRHIQEEFMITFVEMIKINKKPYILINN